MKYPNNIRAVRESLGMSQTALAKLAETSQQQIQRLERGERQLTVKWMERLGSALKVVPQQLMVGGPQTVVQNAVPVIGEVAAGMFRESLEWPHDEQYYISMPTDPRYMGIKTYGAKVTGPSMNQVYPDGSVVHFVYLYDLERDPRTGERVIVRRRNDHDGWEFTVKELRISDNGECWLWPKSHDPAYQTPWKLEAVSDDDAAGAPDLSIVALVIGSYRPE